MGLKQILMNLSWETLVNLPPSDLLALLTIFAVWGFAGVYVLRLIFPKTDTVPPQTLPQDRPKRGSPKA